MQSRRRAVEDAYREIKSPLRGFKWFSRRCAALNVGARRFSRSPARDERPPPRDRISSTGGTRSVASVRRNPNGTSHPPTRRPRRLPPCNLAKTDCGVARYSGRRSHIGLCQIRVCAASAFPRRTRRSASPHVSIGGRDGARPSRFHRRTRQARPSLTHMSPAPREARFKAAQRRLNHLKPRSGDLTI